MSFLARSILAFLIAPPMFGVILFVLSLASPPPLEFTRTVLLSFFVGFPVVAIICAPIFMLLTRQGLTGFVTYLVCALSLSALIVVLIVAAPVVIEERDLTTLLEPAQRREMAMLAAACFLSVGIFWIIARPDRYVAAS